MLHDDFPHFLLSISQTFVIVLPQILLLSVFSYSLFHLSISFLVKFLSSSDAVDEMDGFCDDDDVTEREKMEKRVRENEDYEERKRQRAQERHRVKMLRDDVWRKSEAKLILRNPRDDWRGITFSLPFIYLSLSLSPSLSIFFYLSLSFSLSLVLSAVRAG